MEPLREWLLQKADVDARIIERVCATLAEEECFKVSDLAVLQRLPRFAEILTPVTRQKIVDALARGDTADDPRSPLATADAAAPSQSQAGVTPA